MNEKEALVHTHYHGQDPHRVIHFFFTKRNHGEDYEDAEKYEDVGDIQGDKDPGNVNESLESLPNFADTFLVISIIEVIQYFDLLHLE